MDKPLILAQALSSLKKKVDELSSTVVLQGKDGEQGQKGATGDKGERGLTGLAGYNGKDGKNGADGKDGKDGKAGKDGVSIVNVYFDADNRLTVVLSDGRELDAGSLDFFGGNTQAFTVLKQTQQSGSSSDLTSSYISTTFETTNKNLQASGGTLAYNASNDLTSITYANGIVKTLAYNGAGDLITVILSGTTPTGIDLTKTFSYDAGGNLTSFAYS